MMMTLSLPRLVDSINVAFVSHATYQLTVTNFGDYVILLSLPWYVAQTEPS